MAENIDRTRGRSSNYKLDSGGIPTEFGPFIGTVMNNVDPTRNGRLQVFIEEFAGQSRDDKNLWRTVNYLPHFFGATEHSGSSADVGDYVGNRHSYGMWFTPPDIGTRVLCVFASGDPNQGFYIGVVPEPGLNHMVPAIGASENVQRNNNTQEQLFKNAKRLPVTEINNENDEIREDPQFFNEPKPVHSYTAAVMFQQGLIDDRVRGPIGSSSQRESPSAAYGIATPGRAIYQGGLSERDIKEKLERGEVKPEQATVVGRRGGHTFVMDDGDLEGNDQLVRIRTARGHQILFSDDGDCIHVIHANGQSWVELGKEGVVDIFATNSINLRTQGELNFHADKGINMFGGEFVHVLGKKKVQIESDTDLNIIAQGKTSIHSKGKLGILTNATLGIKADSSLAMSSSSGMSLTGSRIDLNSGSEASVAAPTRLKKTKLPEVEFSASNGWEVKGNKLESIVDRAPTHEPYPLHDQGVDVTVELAPSAPPPAPPAPQAVQASASIETASQETPLNNPIEVEDFISQGRAPGAIGNLSVDQVTGMMAQQAKEVGQAFSEISESGIGKFGFDVDQLIDAGLIKPGTELLIGANATVEEITAVLDSASVWTGEEGIRSLGDFLASESIQDEVQYQILNTAYAELEALGVTQLVDNAAEVAALVQAAGTINVEDVQAWATGQIDGLTSQLKEQIESKVKQAQYAVEFVTKKLPDTIASATSKIGEVGTAVRQGLDSTVESLIGNEKVPSIVYQIDKTAQSAGRQALSALNSFRDQAENLGNRI